MGTYEREAVEKRLHHRLDELVRELAEATRVIAGFREAALRTAGALARLNRSIGEKQQPRAAPLHSVARADPEMAVWMERPINSERK